LGIWLDNLEVEVDQMTVIGCVPLDDAYAVGIMAGRTRGLRLHNVLPVSETLIGQQTGAAVTLIAEGIAADGLGGEIRRGILPGENEWKIRAVGATRAEPDAVVVAIETIDPALLGQRI